MCDHFALPAFDEFPSRRASLKFVHVRRLVESVPPDDVLALLSPDRRRPEALEDQRRGIHQVLDHTMRAAVRMSAVRRCGPALVVPTSLRTPDGLRIGIGAAYHEGIASWDRCEFAGVLVDGQQVCDGFGGAPTLPWEQVPPPPAPERIVGSLFRDHLLAHPERFPTVRPATMERRLRAALANLRRALPQLDPSTLAPFWNDETVAGWQHAAPITVHGAPPLAVVLAPAGGARSARVATILPRHEVYWNVVTSGATPPDWLNPPPGGLLQAG